jgi:pyruvate formate lyase activating enzyme
MDKNIVHPAPILDSPRLLPPETGIHPGHEALLYTPYTDGKVRCHLCAHRGLIPDGERGLCRLRVNHGGKLYTLAYERAIAAHFDPVQGLLYVYFGNVTGAEGQDTLCPGCGRALIHRSGLGVITNHIEDGSCPGCGLPMAGLGMRREN